MPSNREAFISHAAQTLQEAEIHLPRDVTQALANATKAKSDQRAKEQIRAILENVRLYRVISAGPTTSERMNAQTPPIVKQGVTAIIGKGGKSLDVARSFAGRCFYLAFTGGCRTLAQEKKSWRS